MANDDRENVFSRASDWWGERKEREKKRWLEKPEILQDAAQYLRKNVYDPGWIGTQVPGNQTWMETVPSAMMQSYRESESPYRHGITDAAKSIPNAAWNLAQFFGNVGWEGSHALDRMMPKWAGGEGQNVLSDEGKYGLDAWASDKFGWDPYYEDNLYQNAVFNKQGQIMDYDNPYYQKIKKTAQTEANDYWGDMIKKNDKDKDEWHDGATKYAEEQLPWAKWQRANPGVSTKEYYKELTDIYNERMGNLYDDKLDDVYNKSVDSQMFSKYGFGEGKDVSAFEDFDWWDYTRALDYATPEAEEFYKGVEIIPEVVFPVKTALSIPRWLRRTRKSEGIMGAKQITDANKYRHAEEWLKQNAGWRGSGR